MQRQWTDPRNGTEWLVTVSPFGSQAMPRAIRECTVAFHQPGRLPAWTRCRIEKPLLQLADQELMDLFDRAARNGHT